MGILLEHWRFTSPATGVSPILPDGCRDLIMRRETGKADEWFVSALTDTVFSAPVNKGVVMEGYRLAPGVEIDERGLMASLEGKYLETGDILDRLENYVRFHDDIVEVLDCLGSGAGRVENAAEELGVGLRRLQRLVMKRTGRSPLFWIRLARVRKAARAVESEISFAELAEMNGYSDQAHMTRDFQRWFRLSPAQMRKEVALRRQLDQPGYY